MEIWRTCDRNQKGSPSLFPLAMSDFLTEAIMRSWIRKLGKGPRGILTSEE